MKKILVIIMILLFVLSFAACDTPTLDQSATPEATASLQPTIGGTTSSVAPTTTPNSYFRGYANSSTGYRHAHVRADPGFNNTYT